MEDDDASENESIVDYESKQSNGSSTNLHEGDKLPTEVTEAIKSLALVEKVRIGSTYSNVLIMKPISDVATITAFGKHTGPTINGVKYWPPYEVNTLITH